MKNLAKLSAIMSLMATTAFAQPHMGGGKPQGGQGGGQQHAQPQGGQQQGGQQGGRPQGGGQQQGGQQGGRPQGGQPQGGGQQGGQKMENRQEHKDKELLKKIDKIIEDNRKKTFIKPYDIDNGFYKFYVEPTEPLLREVSEHHLTVKNYRKGNNKDYIPLA